MECPFINLTSKVQQETLHGVNILGGMSGHAEKKKLQQQTDLIRRGFRKYLRAQCDSVFHCVNNLKLIPGKTKSVT